MRRLEKVARLQELVLDKRSNISLIECDIDEIIYPLILIMNYSGFQTLTSCGGHRNRILKCWKGDETPLKYFGGYIDFKCNKEALKRLTTYLEARWQLRLGSDAWIEEKEGVTLEQDTEEDSYRLAWGFKTWKKHLALLDDLECFFIEELRFK